MKDIIEECYQRYEKQVIQEMKDPDVYIVDFIPKPSSGWENQSNLENFNHTKKKWLKVNQMINRSLLGRHLGRPGKRPLLLHSFNSYEIYHKTKKKKWIIVPPHLHSVLFVHPKVKDRFKELLVVDSREQVKGLIENSRSQFIDHPVRFRSKVFVGEYGTEIEDSIRSLEIRIPYDLEGKVDYSLGLFENYRPIHPEDVFKYDLEEKMDGMGVFVLPSEHDFKRKTNG